MFCNFCGKQNKDDVLFCEFCGKTMPQKNSSNPGDQLVSQTNQPSQEERSPKKRLSFTAIKAIITGIIIVVVIIVVLLIYYPGILPLKW
jgi:uncharacterized membrane protein YvbJ